MNEHETSPGDSTDGNITHEPEEKASNGATDTAAPQPQSAGGHSDGASGASVRAPLAPGTRVDRFAFGRIIREQPGRAVYIATLAGESSFGMDDSDVCFLAIEQAGEPSRTVQQLIDATLRHPRLLAPCQSVTQDGAHFLLLEGFPASASPAAPAFGSDGPYLSAADVLRAGAGLADALSYLHRNGVVDMHVSPDTVLLVGNRAYLSGLERASLLEDVSEEINALIASDANALARTLAGLAPAPKAGATPESSAMKAIRDIAQQGEANTYTSPEDIAAACGAALQAQPQTLPPVAGDAKTQSIALEAGYATTVGRVRSENQDAVVAFQLNLNDDQAGPDMPLGVFLVADGMGGEAHGEMASRIAARLIPADLLRRYLLPYVMQAASSLQATNVIELSPSGLAQALAQSVAGANRRIREFASSLGQDTGSTLTVIATCGAQAVMAHLGDSRAYLLREGSMVQLTEDHTLLARLQIMDHPILNDPTFMVPRNFLYRSLGQEQAPPDLSDFELSVGDRLVICSDGLWDELDDATIQKALAEGGDPAQCANRLVEMANESGGHDNSTALVIFAQPSRAHVDPAKVEQAKA